jgi:hypothetical protein
MSKARLAAQKTTAPKKNTQLTKAGNPRKWSETWWAMYWNAQYESILRELKNLDYHLRMAQGHNINGKISKSFDQIVSARDLYKSKIHRCDIESLTVVEDTQSLNLGTDGLDRGKA